MTANGSSPMASEALRRARAAVLGLATGGDRDDARGALVGAVTELRHCDVSVDELALVLSLPESVVRRLILRPVD